MQRELMRRRRRGSDLEGFEPLDNSPDAENDSLFDGTRLVEVKNPKYYSICLCFIIFILTVCVFLYLYKRYKKLKQIEQEVDYMLINCLNFEGYHFNDVDGWVITPRISLTCESTQDLYIDGVRITFLDGDNVIAKIYSPGMLIGEGLTGCLRLKIKFLEINYKISRILALKNVKMEISFKINCDYWFSHLDMKRSFNFDLNEYKLNENGITNIEKTGDDILLVSANMHHLQMLDRTQKDIVLDLNVLGHQVVLGFIDGTSLEDGKYIFKFKIIVSETILDDLIQKNDILTFRINDIRWSKEKHIDEVLSDYIKTLTFIVCRDKSQMRVDLNIRSI